MKIYDVAIIGGGPAGSAAAIYLKRRGFDVCILEKKSFPRETLCGEFLSKEVVDSLKELGLFGQFLELSPNPIDSFEFHNEDGKYIKSRLNFAAYGLSRGVFDNFLLNEAKKIGTDVFQPAEVKSVLKTGGYNKVTAEQNEKILEILSKKIVAAYGKQNYLDKQFGRKFTETKSGINGIKFHIDANYFEKLPSHSVQLFFFRNMYCGINIVDKNKVTVCFLEKKNGSGVNAKSDLKKIFDGQPIMKNLIGKEFKKISADVKTYGTGNIYFGKRNLVKDGIYFVGDSSAVIAPFAGDGIGMALQNGKLVAEIFNLQRLKLLDNGSTEKLYLREWGRLFKRRIFYAGVIQNILLSGRFNRTFYIILKMAPFLLSKAIKATRG